MKKIKLKKLLDQFTPWVFKTQSRANNVDVYLNTVVLPMYRTAQGERFKTRGASEGKRWPEHKSAAYERRKRIKYESFLGAGNVMGIATSRLFGSLVGPGRNPFGGRLLGVEDFRKIPEPRKLTLMTVVEYAGFFSDKRDIENFGPAFYQDVKKGLENWILKGTKNANE